MSTDGFDFMDWWDGGPLGGGPLDRRRTIGPRRPKLPPKVQSPGASPTDAVAVVDSVDNPSNPQYATVLIKDQNPPDNGYSIPSNLGLTWAQQPQGDATQNPTVPPTGTAYWNNPTTRKGGSLVTVNTSTKMITSIVGGISTAAPMPLDFVQFIKHTGAFDATHGFQNPPPIDYSQQGTFSSLAAPTLIGTPTVVVDHDGFPVYNETITFTVDSVGTRLNTSCAALQVYAVPLDSIGNPITNSGRVLMDYLPPLTANTNWDGSANINNQATYKVYVGGLSAGTAYRVYLVYEDFAGDLTNAVVLVNNTGTHPLSITNLPGVGTLPIITTNAISYPSVGATSFNAVVQFQMNWAGTNGHVWAEEIKLLAQPCTAVGTPVPNSSPVVVNVIGVNDPSDGTVTYFGEFYGLNLSTPGTTLIYQLFIQIDAFNNTNSGPIALPAVGGSTGTLYTANNPFTVARALLGSMPANYTPVLAVNNGLTDNATATFVYGTTASFTTDSVGTAVTTWLRCLRVVAAPTNGGTASPISSDGKTITTVFETDVIPNASGVYSVKLNALAPAVAYDVWLYYIDYQGNISLGKFIGTTRKFGIAPFGQSLSSGVNIVSSSWNVDLFTASQTLNIRGTCTFSITGVTDFTWLKTVHCYVTPANPGAPFPYTQGQFVASNMSVSAGQVTCSAGINGVPVNFPGSSPSYDYIFNFIMVDQTDFEILGDWATPAAVQGAANVTEADH